MATIKKSDSIFHKRLARFRRMKRGYYAFLLLVICYGLSFFLPVLMNSVALAVNYNGQMYYPFWNFYSREAFGLKGIVEIDYRNLDRIFRKRELAHREGKLVQQQGIYPNNPDYDSARWEPIEDWILGYRIHVPTALASDRFVKFSESEQILTETKKEWQQAHQQLVTLFNDKDSPYHQQPLYDEVSSQIIDYLGSQQPKQVASALLRLERLEEQFREKSSDLSTAERKQYIDVQELRRALETSINTHEAWQLAEQRVEQDQQEGIVFLRYFNPTINPVTVNPSWTPDLKSRSYSDGVGFQLKGHYVDKEQTIAVIDDMTWGKSSRFEALHVKNYQDFAPAILKAEQSLPLENNWVLLPPYPHDYRENFLVVNEYPTTRHWLGTDESGRDILVRMCYGFNISISFALIVLLIAYTVGITMGALLGYFGSWIDLFGLRLVEIWSAIPFLYIVIILSSLVVPKSHPDTPLLLQPSLWLLTCILAAFGWMNISYYIRGEFLREKAKDYVSAALSIGTPTRVIIFKHILPNALTPIISFAPFAIVAYILALVSLDFLGFGLPAPTPSWGELLNQAIKPENGWHMLVAPILFMFFTLMTVVFIGEAVREAFDPKTHSRLR